MTDHEKALEVAVTTYCKATTLNPEVPEFRNAVREPLQQALNAYLGAIEKEVGI